jgi:hypothetical protein
MALVGERRHNSVLHKLEVATKVATWMFMQMLRVAMSIHAWAKLANQTKQ